MTKINILLGFVLFSLALTGCGEKFPEKEQLAGIFQGQYCADGYQLNINPDSSYLAIRVIKSPMGKGVLSERCSGTWDLVFDETAKSWKMVFTEAKDRGFKMVTCSGQIEVWNHEKGYVIGDSVVVMKDLIDGVTVTKEGCEI